MQCSPGKFKAVSPPSNRLAQALLCQACPSGQYQDRMGATECKGCSPGQYNGIGTQGAPVASCFECPLGRWGNVAGGTSLDTGCFLCEAGRFGNTTGARESSNCYACKPGIEYTDLQTCYSGAQGDAAVSALSEGKVRRPPLHGTPLHPVLGFGDASGGPHNADPRIRRVDVSTGALRWFGVWLPRCERSRVEMPEAMDPAMPVAMLAPCISAAPAV